MRLLSSSWLRSNLVLSVVARFVPSRLHKAVEAAIEIRRGLAPAAEAEREPLSHCRNFSIRGWLVSATSPTALRATA